MKKPAILLNSILLLFSLLACSAPPKPDSNLSASSSNVLQSGVIMLHAATTDKTSAQAVSSTFGGLWRLPPKFDGKTYGHLDFTPMETVTDTGIPTSYFSDWSIQIRIRVAGAVDGDSWYSVLRHSNGSSLTWGKIEFLSRLTVGGTTYEDCFVSGGGTLSLRWSCGSNSGVLVFWTGHPTLSLSKNDTCRETGMYSWELYHNGQIFDTKTFEHLPELPPGKVPRFSQKAYNDGYGTVNHYTNVDRNSTIRNYGCAITSIAMVLNYYLETLNPTVAVSPLDVQNWMVNNRGYDKGNLVIFEKFVQLAKSYGLNLTYQRYDGLRSANTDAIVEWRICSSGPQILRVRAPVVETHFFTAIGRDKPKTTFKINDPYYGASSTDPLGGYQGTLFDHHANTYNSARIFVVSGVTTPQLPTNKSNLSVGVISVGGYRPISNVELLLIDPQGRRSGALGTSHWLEIPNSMYTTAEASDASGVSPYKEAKLVGIDIPPEGEYTLMVYGVADGEYELYLEGAPVEGEEVTYLEGLVRPISRGQIHTFRFRYDQSPTSRPQLTQATRGRFPGSKPSRETDAANQLLTYDTPLTDKIDLPTGVRSFDFHVFYDTQLLPGSVGVKLNGIDITSAFQPRPGNSWIASINLVKGRNTLELSGRGTIGGSTASDIDTFVINTR